MPVERGGPERHAFERNEREKRKARTEQIRRRRQRGETGVTTMLAARLHKFGEPMRLERVPVPEPRPTDVLIAVKACGVVPNLNNVLTHWQGWFPELPLPELPAIFGLDVAGEVAAVGDLVQNFR